MSTRKPEQPFLNDDLRELVEREAREHEARRHKEPDPDEESGEDDLRLLAIEEDMNQAARAENTIKAYRCSWGTFERWCATTRRRPLPATSHTLRYFILDCLDKQRKLSTIDGHISAIVAMHSDHRLASPLNERVKTLMRNSARRKREKPVKKQALQPEQLRRMGAYLRERDGRFGMGLRAVRDWAIIQIGFNAGWRRSEIASLTTEDIALEPRGVAIRLSSGSKTDQTAEKQRLIGIERLPDSDLCPVRALEEWLKVRGNWSGALFNPILPNKEIQRRAISGDSISEIVKRALEGVGVDPKPYGGHSLRAGMITTAARNGATLPAIQDRSGHASLQVLMGYIRDVNIFKSNPMRGAFS